jgi:hypothetical protein
VIDSNSCAPGCTRHIRTDPTKQDVFVVDSGSPFLPGSATLFESYSDILKGTAVLMATTPFSYHLLSLALANPLNQLDQSAGVGFLRRSYTNLSNAQAPVYAVVFIGATPDDANALADAQEIGNSGLPIKYSLERVISASASASFDLVVYANQTLAHEFGHKLGLAHYKEIRQVEPTLAAGTNAGALATLPSPLPLKRYAPCYAPATCVGQDKFYVWQQIAHNPAGVPVRQNAIAEPQTGDLAGISPYVGDRQADGYLFADTPGTTDNLYQYTVPAGQHLPTPPTFIQLLVQNFELMDFTPRTNAGMNNLGAWHFDPVLDLPKMCLTQPCPLP